MHSTTTGIQRKRQRRLRCCAVTIGAALTLLRTSVAFAFRTAQDSAALANQGRVRWADAAATFTLNRPNLPAQLTDADVEASLNQALTAWAAPECSAFRPLFAGWTDEMPAPADGVNTIAWVENWEERDFPPSAPGNTDLQYRGREGDWRIAEADIYLNATDFAWARNKGTSTSLDVRAVLTHEIGHALGLLHPCETGSAEPAPSCDDPASEPAHETSMYPLYSAAQSMLATDDIAGLCYLYPASEDECGGCGRNELCEQGECRTQCRDQVCAKQDVCGFWGCVPAGACTDRTCIGTPCESDVTCGPLAECRDRVCSKGKAAWGDRCATNAECEAGACVEGVCQPDCIGAHECGPNGSCELAVDGKGRGCIGSGAYAEGMACVAGDDCSSGLCVFVDTGAQCTTACTATSECPSAWSCNLVEKRRVCVPPEVRSAGSCSLSSGAASERSSALEGLIATLGLVAAVRRQKRVRKKP